MEMTCAFQLLLFGNGGVLCNNQSLNIDITETEKTVLKMYTLKHTDVPEVFLTPRHEGCCCLNVIVSFFAHVYFSIDLQSFLHLCSNQDGGCTRVSRPCG
jgi:hypothetical protein